MATHFSDPHLCPVCWQNWVRGNRIYCSANCRSIASDFLSRTYYNREVLEELGFKLTKSDGIFFEIEIPEGMKPFYPKYNEKFCFPAPGLSIEALSGEALFVTAEGFLGKHIMQVIRDFTKGKVTVTGNAYTWLHKRVLTYYNHPAWTTFCPKCCVKRITSEEGWDTENDCCTDCSIASIPF